MKKVPYKGFILTYNNGLFGLKKKVVRVNKNGEQYDDSKKILSTTYKFEDAVERLIIEATMDSDEDRELVELLNEIKETRNELRILLKDFIRI